MANVKKRVLLLSPRNPIYESTRLPPLGLCVIASYIPDHYEIIFVDENFESMKYDVDIALISANSVTARQAYEHCETFRSLNIPTVIGGIHPSLMPEEAARYADSVVVGNGEVAIPEIMRDFENGSLKKTYKPPMADLSECRIPRRDILGNHYGADLVETAKGCPFDCDFCSVTIMNGKRYRYKPIDVVREDLKTIRRKRLFIADDNFFGYGPNAEKRALQLMDLLCEFNFNWLGQTSINIAEHPEVLKRARKSGAASFFIGFESINEDFLRAAGKSINIKKGIEYYRDAVRKIHDHGITIMGSFMIGSDFDTKDGLDELHEFIHKTEIDATYVKPISPLPGTRLYDRFKEEGRFFNDNFWLEKPYPLFTYKPDKLSMDELIEATEIFLARRSPLEAVRRFLVTLWRTGNLAGAVTNYISSTGDYKSHYRYLAESVEQYRNREVVTPAQYPPAVQH